jgi:hypothetical protein
MGQPAANNWIDLENWGKGMDGFKLPSSVELVGKKIKLYFSANNIAITYIFHTATFLTWEILEGPDKGQSNTETYEAMRVAPNIYFVDFIKKNQPKVSVSMALDLNTGKATVLIATAPDRKEASQSFVDRLGKGIDLSTVKVSTLHANVNPASPDEPVVPHERTSELVGKRIKYTYSNDHVYEHIYLSDRLFTWHCLVGLEKGLADTEICDYFKITPDIYLFAWREKIMPTFGAVLINLKEMRSNGKTFGLDLASGKFSNFTMGSRAELINETIYF